MSEFKWGTKGSRKATIKRISDWAESNDVTVTMLGTDQDQADFAPAIVGVMMVPRPAVIYDINKVVACFMRVNKWTEEEAWEWYSFNTERGIEYLPAEDNPPIMITGIEYVC